MRELTNLDGFLLIQSVYCLPHQSSQLLILLQLGLCQLMLFQSADLPDLGHRWAASCAR